MPFYDVHQRLTIRVKFGSIAANDHLDAIKRVEKHHIHDVESFLKTASPRGQVVYGEVEEDLPSSYIVDVVGDTEFLETLNFERHPALEEIRPYRDFGISSPHPALIASLQALLGPDFAKEALLRRATDIRHEDGLANLVLIDIAAALDSSDLDYAAKAMEILDGALARLTAAKTAIEAMTGQA